MKRISMARFQCISCGAVQLVEMEHPDEEVKLPLGWCGLKGWWQEGVPGEAEGEVKQDNVPLGVEACSYGCMGKFIDGALLRADTIEVLAPRHSNAQTPCEAGTPQA